MTCPFYTQSCSMSCACVLKHTDVSSSCELSRSKHLTRLQIPTPAAASKQADAEDSYCYTSDADDSASALAAGSTTHSSGSIIDGNASNSDTQPTNGNEENNARKGATPVSSNDKYCQPSSQVRSARPSFSMTHTVSCNACALLLPCASMFELSPSMSAVNSTIA